MRREKKNIMLPPVASRKHFIFTQELTKGEKKVAKVKAVFDISCLLQLILVRVYMRHAVATKPTNVTNQKNKFSRPLWAGKFCSNKWLEVPGNYVQLRLYNNMF